MWKWIMKKLFPSAPKKPEYKVSYQGTPNLYSVEIVMEKHTGLSYAMTPEMYKILNRLMAQQQRQSNRDDMLVQARWGARKEARELHAYVPVTKQSNKNKGRL